MKNKNGISLITLVITIIVMIILATIVVLTFKNTNIIGDSNETKYKNELKKFDQEVRSNIASAYLKDDTIIYRVITDPEEIKKYSQDLVNSEYINYAYISEGQLTLRGNMLTNEQKIWAQEANIKIDYNEIVFTQEKVMISLSEDDYTYGPISATLNFSEIPNGYEIQYKIGSGKWTNGNYIDKIENNCTVYARLYDKDTYDDRALNSKDITKIDKNPPTIIEVKQPIGWSKDGILVEVIGAQDRESGLAELAFSFDNGVTWQKESSKYFNTNQQNVIIKVRDRVGNTYTHEPINLNAIDDISPVISDVIGNPTEWVNGEIVLKIVGATDNESGLADIPYSFDNGETWQASNEKIYTKNTSNIIIKVRDISGNIYTHEVINIEFIDNDSPIIKSVSGNSTTWTNGEVILKIEDSKDELSGLADEPYSFDGGATWQSNNTKIYKEKTKNIIIKVKDKVGNVYTHNTINIDKIDNINPIITNVTGNPTTWTNNDVTLTINGASDNESGLAEESYSFDNGVNWQAENTKTYTSNMLGIVIKVKDKAGNIYTHEPIDIIYIDKDIPTITNLIGIPNGWTNQDVILTIDGAGDEKSGLVNEPYSFDGGTTWQTSNTKTYTENTAGIVIQVRDNAGNIYIHDTIDIIYIDKELPTITSVTGNPTEWINNNVTLTINGAKDISSGLHETEPYSFDGGTTWQTSNTKTYTENTAGIVIKVKDKTGNVYTHESINIEYIDKAAPSKPTEISITPNINTITVKASGSIDTGSGIAGYRYKLGENGTWSDIIPENLDYTFDDEMKSGTAVEVYAKAVDNIGFESSVYGPVDGTTSTVTNKVTITLSEEGWTKGPITADLSYMDIPTGYVLQYKIGTQNWIKGTEITEITENVTLYARLYNETLDDEIATNSKDVSKIDTVLPTKPTSLSLIEQGVDTLTISADGSQDIGSGFQKYEYSINQTKWWATGKFIDMLPGRTYTFYVRAVDNVGNISEVYEYDFRTLNQYNIIYNSNTTDAVSNIPTTQTKVEGVTLQLNTSVPTRTGYRFLGWSTTSSGSVEYVAGANYTNDSALALYAVWEMAYYQNTTTSKLYVTLNEAITDSATGTQINAIRNATEKVVATNTSGKTLTLNLNGKTISFNDGYNLVNAGTLTLIGSGKITANTGHTINNSGTLNVNLDNETSYNDGTGGIIEMTSALNVDRALQSSGTLNINSGIIVNSAVADEMTSTEFPYTIVCSGIINMNGGVVRAISSDYSTQYGLHTTGTFTMSGGTIEAVGTALYTNGSGNTTITGGKIITGGVNNTTQRVAINHKSTGTLQFSGTNVIQVYSKLSTSIYNQLTGSITINNSNLVVNALTCAINNVSTGQITINSGTYKMTSTTSGNCIHNTVGGKIIINGGTFTGQINSCIYNKATGTIEINGGTISSLLGMTNNAGGTIKVTGGTITGTTTQGILNNGAGTINITGGSVIGYNNGIYGSTNSTGTVTVTGGNITGQNSTGIYGNWSTVTLGTNNTSISTTSPAITGKTYGINMTAGTLNFYDGVVKGAKAINNTVTGLPTNYGVVTTTANSVQTATLAKKYYVKYNANGGSGTMANSTHLYGVSKALTANSFTRTGYNFLGWSTSSTATTATYTNSKTVSNLTTTAGATVNLYAVWQPKTVEVTFMRNTSTSDTTSAKQTFTYGVTGQSFSAKGWTKSGYTLLGWSASKTATAKTWNVTSGVSDAWINSNSPKITIYAVWQENITITFTSSNGQGNINSSGVYSFGTGGTSSVGTWATIPANCTVYYTCGFSTSTSGSPTHSDSSSASVKISLDGTTVASHTGSTSSSFKTTQESKMTINISTSVSGGSGGAYVPSASIKIEKIVLNSTGQILTLAKE